ncbi:WAS/WASL-interacting protein family member 1-like [Myiozetetes cayanensis]|uniref:WAS/WASL-interacting protein family member 1-like n=1 Tax=Myiozetetes cayanensis TaxID=478635 RepID=UPI00215F727F|nr:WAS/WASL-interacting protein family member 1-like [Myiozetetes cayanensis]
MLSAPQVRIHFHKQWTALAAGTLSEKDGEKEEKLVGQEEQKQDEPHRPSQPPREPSGRSPGHLTPPAPTCPSRLPPLPRRCYVSGRGVPTCSPRSPLFRASAFPPGKGSPAASRSPAPPLPSRPRPARTAGGGRWRRTAASRPRPLRGLQETGKKERVSSARPPEPGPGAPLPRQTRRAPGTSTWGLRHQCRAAPPARVTSSPSLPARGGTWRGSGWRRKGALSVYPSGGPPLPKAHGLRGGDGPSKAAFPGVRGRAVVPSVQRSHGPLPACPRLQHHLCRTHMPRLSHLLLLRHTSKTRACSHLVSGRC